MKAINRIMKAIQDKGLTPYTIEKDLSLSNGYLATMLKRDGNLGEDVLVKIAKHLNLSLNYLLEGKEEKNGFKKASEGIPLVKLEAIAGIGNMNYAIKETDIQQYYVVPDFKQIDFMIRITGSSMYPKYNSGDIVACRILHEPAFIQWNKVHVLATEEQGILIKRIKKGSSVEQWLCISDNKDFDPFEIPRKQVTGIALVIGVIRLE